MAELINAAGSGSKDKFYEALKEALSGNNDFENSRNILPIAYDILAEKLAEVDRVWSATKNDNYLSIAVADEVIIRSENVQDRLSIENAFRIDRIGNTSSTEVYSENQSLAVGTTTILLANKPSDPTNIRITNINAKTMVSQVSVLYFDETINSVRIQPITFPGFYKIEYTTTGDIFINNEVKTFEAIPTTQITLQHNRLLFGSEQIYPPNGTSLVKDIDYVINYPDGVIDFLNSNSIANQTFIIQYSYQRDLLNDIVLFSHVPVRNEIATPDVTNPFIIYTQLQPIQDVTRIQNLTSGETYNVLSVTGNEIRFNGNRPTWTITDQTCTETSKNLDFINRRYIKEGTVNYPDGVSTLNHPLVTLNTLTTKTKAIRLSVANQIITGKDSTAYQRMHETNSLVLGATSVVLKFIPSNFAEAVLYKVSDPTKTNLIVPTTFNIASLQLNFVTLDTLPLPAGDYVVKYDTLQWIIYSADDVNTLEISTGGVLLRNSTKRLRENEDFTLVKGSAGFLVTFTAQGAVTIGNNSSFYTLTRDVASFEVPPVLAQNYNVFELQTEITYNVSYREGLKNESVQFSNDPLDLIPLLKLERFRERNQNTDTIVNPTVRVLSLDGSSEYTVNVDFTIDYANKTIKRIDATAIQPLQRVIVFYEDVEDTMVNFTYVSDIIQIDYEYGDNAVDHTPTITDTPVTRLEALRAGTWELKLNDYPANYKQVKITNTLYSERPSFYADAFDSYTKILSFPAIQEDGTYLFEYVARSQLFNEGAPYYVSYRYGARRDRLQNYFAYLRNLDIGQVFRQDEVALMSDQVTQQLLYHPLNFYDVKIYAKDDNTKTPVTKVTTYNGQTNTVTFDPIENAGHYIFEYYTFNRDVEQLRKGLVGLSKAMPQVPTKNAFLSLLGEYTATAPEIKNVSDKRFQIRKRVKTTEVVNVGQTYLPVSNVSNLPKSGTVIVYGLNNTTETITYSFIAGKRLEGIPVVGYGSLTLTHPIGSRVVVQNNETGTYNLNPLSAKEAESVEGVRAVKFVPSLFGAGMLCDSTLKGWVKYSASNNVNINEGTLCFWTGTKYDGSDTNDHYYVDIAKGENRNKNRLSIFKSNKGYLQFEIRDALGKLMSIRVDVRRKVVEEIVWLEIGQTEVPLSNVPALAANSNGTEIVGGLSDGAGSYIPGTKLVVQGWERETNKLLIQSAPVAGNYFFSYVTGFVNFDETEHFIEATWKVHTNDGIAPRLRLYVDGVKYEQRSL